MRPVSFVWLREIAAVLARVEKGVTAEEFDRIIRAKEIIHTTKENPPSRTWLYHYRNTLTKLGIFLREGRKYFIDKDNENVRVLLANNSRKSEGLTVAEKTAFAELVIKNEDCKIFFDLFMPGIEVYSLSEYLSEGKPVTWRREGEKPKIKYYPTRAGKRRPKERPRKVVFRRLGENEPILNLTDYYEEKGILFGVRYWGINELGFVDEFFREDTGAIIYPAIIDYGESEVREVLNKIIELVDSREEWTVFSVRGLILKLMVSAHKPTSILYEAIKTLKYENPTQVVFIGTSRGFATYTAATKEAQELMLRSYFEDDNRRIVSHFRVHKSVRKV